MEKESSKKAIIRPARPEDAPVVAQLMYYASANYVLAFFGNTKDTIKVLRRMFSLPRHTTSYTYAFVAEVEGDVVGSFSGLDGESWRASAHASWMYGPVWFAITPLRQLPRMVAAFVDFNRAMLPILDEEYYIEHLAVLPEKRGQGLGTQLIEFAESQARTKWLKRVTLDVEIENEGARRLCERLGFQTIKVVTEPSYCKRFNIQGSIRMAKPSNPRKRYNAKISFGS
jgi:ribosomal protein S18 acetylase RimI-like enzyme